jgi:hypothetical protein
MTKATKSRSAKSKRAAAKPKRAAAKSKRAAAKPKRAAAKHKRKAGASLPVVRLVTPADATDKNPSQKSFEKLLKKLLGSSIDYKPCYGKYDTTTLAQAANDAVTAAYAAVDGGQPAVIVARWDDGRNDLAGYNNQPRFDGDNSNHPGGGRQRPDQPQSEPHRLHH